MEVIYTLNGGIGFVRNEQLIADTSGVNGIIIPNYLIEKILSEMPIIAYVKYARSSSGHYDEFEQWHWDALAPMVNSESEIVVKFCKDSYTRKELLDVIAEFKTNGGKIPDPIGLLNAFFHTINYPLENE